MSDEPHMDQLLDAAGAQRGPGHPPEGTAVVAKEPDAGEQLYDNDDGAAQIGGIDTCSGQWRADAVGISVLCVPGKAVVDGLGLVGMADRPLPALQHFVIGASEHDIRLPPSLVVESSGRVQTLP